MVAPAFVSWVACAGLQGLAGSSGGVDAVVAAVDGSRGTRVELGRSAEGRAVTALVVPGRQPDHRVLVLGGVHGSEQGGIELAERMGARLRQGRPRPTVVLVSPLFADHAAARRREDPAQPTNRNFPRPGTSWRGPDARDAEGRAALPENRWLVQLVDELRPDRIVSLHGTVRPHAAGVFADPHRWPGDPRRAEARTAADAALAIQVARTIAETHPELVAGNRLDEAPTAVWSGGVRGGVSLGRWAPHPVPDVRESVGVLTVEVPGNDRSDDHTGEARRRRARELDAFADALSNHVLALEPR